MNFKDFIKNDGFKKLALIRLKSVSYSILAYLFNEIISGADEIISSRRELSSLLGWDERQINDGIDELLFCHMIHIIEVPSKPLRIRVQLNFHAWNQIYTSGDSTPKYTLVNSENVHPINNPDPAQGGSGIKLVNSQQIQEPIPFPKNKIKLLKKNRESKNKTKLNENSLNDLAAFREKHELIDSKIKELAQQELQTIRLENRTVTNDEILLLKILSQHHQPRKQLFLALRSNLIYPNLKLFLDTARICAEIPILK